MRSEAKKRGTGIGRTMDGILGIPCLGVFVEKVRTTLNTKGQGLNRRKCSLEREEEESHIQAARASSLTAVLSAE